MGRALIARFGMPRKFVMRRSILARYSDQELLAWGEDFLLHPDVRISQVPLVRLFGPGKHWRVVAGDLEIFGEGHDGANPEQLLMILEMRRKCEVYGKWFSQYCRDGEFGTRLFSELELMSEPAYLEALIKLRERTW